MASASTAEMENVLKSSASRTAAAACEVGRLRVEVERLRSQLASGQERVRELEAARQEKAGAQKRLVEATNANSRLRQQNEALHKENTVCRAKAIDVDALQRQVASIQQDVAQGRRLLGDKATRLESAVRALERYLLVGPLGDDDDGGWFGRGGDGNTVESAPKRDTTKSPLFSSSSSSSSSSSARKLHEQSMPQNSPSPGSIADAPMPSQTTLHLLSRALEAVRDLQGCPWVGEKRSGGEENHACDAVRWSTADGVGGRGKDSKGARKHKTGAGGSKCSSSPTRMSVSRSPNRISASRLSVACAVGQQRELLSATIAGGHS